MSHHRGKWLLMLKILWKNQMALGVIRHRMVLFPPGCAAWCQCRSGSSTLQVRVYTQLLNAIDPLSGGSSRIPLAAGWCEGCGTTCGFRRPRETSGRRHKWGTRVLTQHMKPRTSGTSRRGAGRAAPWCGYAGEDTARILAVHVGVPASSCRRWPCRRQRQARPE